MLNGEIREDISEAKKELEKLNPEDQAVVVNTINVLLRRKEFMESGAMASLKRGRRTQAAG